MLTDKIKRRLCRTSSIYDNGKLKVPMHTVLFFGLGVSGIIVMGLWYLHMLIKDTIKALEALVIVVGVIGGLAVVMYLTDKANERLIPQFIKTYLKHIGSKIEITCDMIVFPEEVKNIYAEIEALDKEKQSTFLKGIYPLLRKIENESRSWRESK